MSRSARNATLGLVVLLLAAGWLPLRSLSSAWLPAPVESAREVPGASRLVVRGTHRLLEGVPSAVTGDRESARTIATRVVGGRVDVVGVRLPIAAAGRPSPATLPRRIVIRFGFACAALQPAAEAALRRWVARLPGDTTATVTGHTDEVGSTQSNVTLSRDRAQAVARVVRAAGLTMVDVGWRGEDMPIAANRLPDGTDNPDGRRLNRRVVVDPKLRPGLEVRGDPQYLAADPAGPCLATD